MGHHPLIISFMAAILAGLLAGLLWLRRHPARRGLGVHILFWGAIILLGGLSFWRTFVVGSPVWLLLFAGIMLPLLRLWQENAVKALAVDAAPRTGRISLLQTPWMALTADHDSGQLSAQARQGAMQGWQCAEMDGHDLKCLHEALLANDSAGAVLLELWLDRHGPVHWRLDFNLPGDHAVTAAPPPPGKDEAAALLGVKEETLTPDIIEAAATRLTALTAKGDHAPFMEKWIAAARGILSR